MLAPRALSLSPAFSGPWDLCTMVILQDFHDRLRVKIAVGVVNFVVERVLMDSCSKYRDLVERNWSGEIDIVVCRFVGDVDMGKPSLWLFEF